MEYELELDSTQEAALDELCSKLGVFVRNQASLGSRDRRTQHPAFSNAFGILGERGSGKSTLLSELYERWRDVSPDESTIVGNGDFAGIRMLPPIDCSVLPSDIAPGTAILLALSESLAALPAQREVSSSNADYAELAERISDLVSRYTRTERSYRELCLDISSAPSDYSYYVTQGLKERLALGDDLRSWLERVVQFLGIELFVVLLDDFDLVPASEVRKWLLGMLDELNQHRFAFVLTADFHRLVHLSWDASAEFDDKTGRALLDKLLPTQNRINLCEWTSFSRYGFRPLPDPESETLWQLMPDEVAGSETVAEVVRSLLPRWPRGLGNLYDSLSLVPDVSPALGEEAGLQRFFGRLATCRNEPLLARRIDEVDLEQWVDLLELADADVTVEDWHETVRAASESPSTTQQPRLLPLRALIRSAPSSQRLQGRGAEGARDFDSENSRIAGPPISVAGDDARIRDPLRHELLWRLPLRDALERDQPFWAELLVDCRLQRSPLSRVKFATRWAPIANRFRASRFVIPKAERPLRALFEDNAGVLERAALYWIAQEPSTRGNIEIGWNPLLEGLRNARDPLLSTLLAELFVDTSAIRGDLPPAGRPDALALLPGQVRAMVLLADGLDRCPWAAFSRPLGWRVSTFLGLAAAFVRSAYVLALPSRNQVCDSMLSKEQRLLIEILKTRDPSHMLNLEEEEVLQTLLSVLTDNLPSAINPRGDAVSEATAEYLRSPVYKSVCDLIHARRLGRAARRRKGKARRVASNNSRSGPGC